MDLSRTWRDARHRLWLKLAIRGNEDAFRRLYGELYNPVASYTARRVRHREDAEDLTGAIFHRFLERIADYRPEKGSVLSWVLAMARHAVIDRQRRLAAHGGARINTHPLDGMVESLAAPTRADALGQMVRDEDLARVEAVLQGQPTLVREMFDLRYGQGLRVREVAAVLGLSEAAVKQRFARAHRLIRQELLTDRMPPSTGKEGSPCTVVE